MIQATSGKRFEDKVVEEMTNLSDDAAKIYGLVSVATSFRFSLSRQEILLATGDETNTVLNSLDMLARRHILRENSDGSLMSRHRILAEVIRDRLQQSGQLSGVVYGLALLAATQVNARLRRSAKPWRILRAMLNHAFLQRSLGIESTRNLYGDLEPLLSWDYHYWLQRGSFEVEFGDLSLAENFLNQARGLSPDDPYVETERAYLMYAQAIAAPNTERAITLVEEATASLELQMARLDRRDVYPFHVLGSQAIAWSRKGPFSAVERERYLRKVLQHVEEGAKRNPREPNLQQLVADVRREYLNIAVNSQKGLFPPSS
jgi:hypothetical protein